MYERKKIILKGRVLMRNEILQQLMKEREENYKDFNCKLIPGVDKNRVLGIRIPKLRKIAKEISNANYMEYIKELPQDCYYEERMIHGMILGYIKIEIEKEFGLIRDFVPYINDWATCDSVATGLKKSRKNLKATRVFLDEFLKSKEEYKSRFGVVMLLAHFINEDYIDDVLSQMATLETDRYYVMMAVAWTVSVCYIKFPDKTTKLFESNRLDGITQNKSIQKIRDSYRVAKEDKEKLLLFKRNL